MHYNIWGLLCDVHATAKDKSKDKKKNFLWTQNVYVIITYIS